MGQYLLTNLHCICEGLPQIWENITVLLRCLKDSRLFWGWLFSFVFGGFFTWGVIDYLVSFAKEMVILCMFGFLLIKKICFVVAFIPTFLPTSLASDSERTALGEVDPLLLCDGRHICVENNRGFSFILFFICQCSI